MSNYVRTPEIRAKISAAKMGRPNPHSGIPRSPETRAKMSAAHKGQKPAVLTIERVIARNTRHGHARRRTPKTPTYFTWASMIQRCTNPNDARRWKNYGGRGITVCDRWLVF